MSLSLDMVLVIELLISVSSHIHSNIGHKTCFYRIHNKTELIKKLHK